MVPADITVDPTDLQTIIIGAAALVVAWGVLWRSLLKPAYKRLAVAAEIIHREMTPNGGHSMKDSATKAAAASAALRDQVQEIHEAQETIFQLFDNVVERKETDHDEIWQALRSLGFDRRHDR